MCRWVYICMYNKVSNDFVIDYYYLCYIFFVKVGKSFIFCMIFVIILLLLVLNLNLNYNIFVMNVIF